jgi:hypothetical protein
VIHSQKDNNIKEFEDGNLRHLVFVSIVSEGYDYPPIDAIVLMRPTRSPVLYVQIVGRGLRPYKDKVNCLVLDYGRVIETLGHISDPLINAGKKSKGVTEIKMKFCPQCYEYCQLSAQTCPECEYQFSSSKKEVNLKNLTSTTNLEKVEETWGVVTRIKDGHTKTKNGYDARVVTVYLQLFHPSKVVKYFTFPFFEKHYKDFIISFGKKPSLKKLEDPTIHYDINYFLEARIVKKGQYYEIDKFRADHTKPNTGLSELQQDILLQS